jgi:divalent metal cation (Fe/Co/Zn/Cd) transporter
MASSESSKTVFLAMSVNFSIGVAKSIIATITMSSAMFSEAVHSFVDTGNQFLLWFGIKQAKKSNPKIYPLGRGREEYFWTLVVAVLIFTIGGLVSLEHGIESLSHPKKLENLSISLTLLIVSIILESYVLKKAISELKRGKVKNKGILKLLKESTDGPLIAIVVEDFAATLGINFCISWNSSVIYNSKFCL